MTIQKEPPEGNGASRLLTVQEAAAFLGVPVSWVYEQTRRGAASALPVVHVGRYRRFRVADLESWVAANTVGGESATMATARG